jgi:hypothetical protein
MGVFGQDIVHSRTIMSAGPVASTDRLLTVRHSLDPPPPRA